MALFRNSDARRNEGQRKKHREIGGIVFYKHANRGGAAVERTAGQGGQLPGGRVCRAERREKQRPDRWTSRSPECWSEDPERCRQAKIPESERQYRSKPELALEMIRRAVDLGLEFGWVGFDALYGSTPWLLREIEDMGRIFVGDVRNNFPVYEEDPRLSAQTPRRSRAQVRQTARPL